MKRLLVCLLFVGCVSAARVGDEAAVIQTLHDACKAYLDGDAARIEYLLTDDFTLTDADGVVTTREDDLRHARNGSLKYSVFENRDMKGGCTATRRWSPESPKWRGTRAPPHSRRSFNSPTRWCGRTDAGAWPRATSRA